MRSGLAEYTTGARSNQPEARERWSALLDRYDGALVQAAGLLGLAVPDPPPASSGGGRRLTDESRTHLEFALFMAGMRLDPP
jgi:hypothetical protein